MTEEAPSAPQADIPPLSQLYFYLTAGCNLACRHCWLAPPYDPHADRAPVLAPGQFERIITEARPLGLTTVKLTGGEPLLHPDVERLLTILRQNEIGLTIETNGTLLTPALVQRLGDWPQGGAPSLSVSLDGIDAATHDRIRCVPGAFDRALDGVRLLVAAGLAPQIIFTVMRENSGQAERMVALAEGLGAGSLKFNILQPIQRGQKLHDEHAALDISEHLELARAVHGASLHRAISVLYHVPPAFRPLSSIGAAPGFADCGIHTVLGVLPTGEYALCGIGEVVPELVFGRAGRDPLRRVWEDSPVLVRLRRDLPSRLEGICADCIMRARCLGSCVAETYVSTGSLTAPFWFCEQAERAGLFPPGRRHSHLSGEVSG